MPSRQITSFRSTCLLALILCCISALPSHACTIPVFRFALDRWAADPYILEVPPDLMDKQAIRDLLKTTGETAELNLRIVESRDGKTRFYNPWQGNPFMPDNAFSEAWLNEVIDSPARQQLIQHILSGNSAVWVMVESGNKEADDALHERMKARLDFFEAAATLPPQDPLDPESRLGPGPELKIQFSILRIRRDDPAEASFIRMLTGPEAERVLSSGEPFASPVFGRGRVLGAWTASQLDQPGLDELNDFLLGACSCQVKAQNPGWDVLLKVDWQRKLFFMGVGASEQAATGAPSASTSPSRDPAPEPEIVRIEGVSSDAGPTETTTADTPQREPRVALASLAVAVLALLLFGFWHTVLREP